VGLTLVRQLAHLHGGSLHVRSDEVDSGTEVILDLPMERTSQTGADDSESASRVPIARPLRIVVADDNEDARDMMRYFLESEGHTVATAGDGPSALSAIEKFGPDVAILDIGMPGLNGYKVAEQIRHASRHQSLTLVALSGLGQEEDKRLATEACFDVHFTKPVDIPALKRLLASIAARSIDRAVEPEN
jgi:CheY-like chemotaxis protein